MKQYLTTSQAGLALIKRFEGFSPEPYDCPAGYKTIGYGHVIQPHEMEFKAPISQHDAEILLKQDVKAIEPYVNQMVRIKLLQHEFDALISLVYNTGIHAFEKSTLLRFLNDGKRDKAACEFSRWVYAGGKKLAGLVKRRAAENRLFTGKT